MDIYDKILFESKKNKKLLFFQGYAENVSFCGYVVSYNAEIIQIHHFTKYGKDDGILNINYSDINYIIEENEYLDSLKYIIENNSLLDKGDISVLPIQPHGDWRIQILEEYKNDESSILDIEINGSWYYGFIRDVDNQFFIFSELDRNGFILDRTIFKLGELTSVHINDLEGRKRLLLYNWRKKGHN